MYRVMLVVENRGMLKRLYSYLENKAQYAVEIVSSSTGAYDKFVETRAEIIVLDSMTMVPTTALLKQFQQSQWPYHVLLLPGEAGTPVQDANVTCLEQSALTADTFIGAIAQAAKPGKETRTGEPVVLNWKGHLEFTSYPDVYYILMAKYVGAEPHPLSPECMRQLKAATAHIGELEMMTADKRDLLCSMRKTKMRPGFEFETLGSLLLGILGKEYAILYQENVKWSVLEEAYMEITSLCAYGYYFRGETLSIDQLTGRMKPVPILDIRRGLGEIYHAVLRGNEKETKRHLKELYLYRLKPCLDAPACQYIFCALQQFVLLFQAAGIKDLPLLEEEAYRSIEQEYQSMEQALLQLCRTAAQAALPEIAIKTAQALLTRFQENLSLESLADELHVNKVYLGRAFRNKLHATVLSVLRQMRMGLACFLLTKSTLKIGEIAQVTGYRDAGYFSKIFKGQEGIPPEEYRRHAPAFDLDRLTQAMDIGQRLLYAEE